MENEVLEKMKEALYWAIRDQEHQKVRQILTEYPELVDARIDAHNPPEFGEISGYTPLLTALSYSDIPMFKMILEDFHADPNISDLDAGFTALFRLSNSSKEDKKELVDLLLEKGADVNKASIASKTPLMLAAQTGYLEMVKKLLAHGAHADARDRNNSNALRWMCQYLGEDDKNLIDEIVTLLVQNGADLYNKDDFGDTPLSLSQEYNEPLVEKALRKHMRQ
jgi:cytohesin